MAIFPNINTENIIQVNDKIRISAAKTFITQDESAITLVEIEPHTGEGYIDVTNADFDELYLDWAYSTDGTKTISLRVTTDGIPVTITKDITCISVEDDKLFSTDQDLQKHEVSILKFVPRGKNSFNYVHRLAQNEILEQLYKDGYTKTDNTKLTKAEVLRTDELAQWSKYMVLRLIFRDLSNALDDIYDKKSKNYESAEHLWRTKAVLKLDYNGDGVQGEYEAANITTTRLVRV